jgi:hypothetical protein
LRLARRLGLVDLQEIVERGWADRPAYAYCVYHAAVLARRLGYRAISVIEYGVAGGSGLVALERLAADISSATGVEIQVYGFDTGHGLPAPRDYRDLPYHWKQGFFQMDKHQLEQRIDRAQLVLGDIQATAKTFFSTHRPAPIGAVMHDFDLYSSTVAGLSMFDVDERYRLPRVYCYFDDIIGSDVELYNDFTGERLAIEEFNSAHPDKKLSKAYHLITRHPTRVWYYQIYVLHDFAHSRYNDFVSADNQQLPLGAAMGRAARAAHALGAWTRSIGAGT